MQRIQHLSYSAVLLHEMLSQFLKAEFCATSCVFQVFLLEQNCVSSSPVGGLGRFVLGIGAGLVAGGGGT